MADTDQVAAASEPYDPANDPKRRAKSKDPAWKYGFWPDLNTKDVLQCKFCGKRVHAGVGRLKRHLAGGYGDVEKCGKVTAAIRKEMHDYLKSNSRKFKPTEGVEEDEAHPEGGEDADADVEEEEVHPSSGTAAKRKQSATSFVVAGPPQKCTKSVASMVRKTPEEVVSERHSATTSQPTLEHITKNKKEEKQIVDDHVDG